MVKVAAPALISSLAWAHLYATGAAERKKKMVYLSKNIGLVRKHEGIPLK